MAYCDWIVEYEYDPVIGEQLRTHCGVTSAIGLVEAIAIGRRWVNEHPYNSEDGFNRPISHPVTGVHIFPNYGYMVREGDAGVSVAIYTFNGQGLIQIIEITDVPATIILAEQQKMIFADRIYAF